MSKNFRVFIAVEATVVTNEDKTAQWVEDNVLDDFHDELVGYGYIVGDMGVQAEDAPASPLPATPVSMNAYERFACAECLYAFPNDKTFDEVMQMLEDGDDEVWVWEAFEHLPAERVVDIITSMRDSLMRAFVPRVEAR